MERHVPNAGSTGAAAGRPPGGACEHAFIGRAPAIAQLRALIAKLSRSNSTTLIRGETGTGKELVAMMLHRSSLRAAPAAGADQLRGDPRDADRRRVVRL